jgi:dihydrolipoamide dehydrogenase
MDKYDIAIIGAGPGGYICAIRAGQLGLKTALIEKDARLGGVCLNVGCIPSKALLESSEWFANANHKFAEHGIKVGTVKLDLKTMMARKETVVKILTDGIGMLMKKHKVTVIKGMGRLTTADRIAVEGADNLEIEAKNIVLAMGSLPVEPPFMPFDGEHIVSSTETLAFTKVPEHLIIVGGGAIGLELGSVWARLGAKVSVVEMLPQIAPFADKQMSTMLLRSLKSQGLEFYLKAKVTGAEVKSGKVTLTFENEKGEKQTLEGDKVLCSVGRKPNSGYTGLEIIGVKVEKNGMIPVDAEWRTNVRNIHAIGDLIHGPMLAHKAEEEGIAVAETLAGKPGHVNYDVIPNVIYTNPELAMVGLTEEQARDRKIKYKVGKFYFQGNGRALSLGETDGLVKVMADETTDRLIGVHILGPRASDLIAEAVMAFEFGASAEDVARTVHAHPTLAEAFKEAALAVDKRQIHG